MDNNDARPTLSQLRNRQTELVLALATESRSDRLQQYSDELEFLVKHIQEREEAEAAGASATPESAEQAQGSGAERDNR